MIIRRTICLSFIWWSFKTTPPGGGMLFLVTVRLSPWRCSRNNPAKIVFCVFVEFFTMDSNEKLIGTSVKTDSLTHNIAWTRLISKMFQNYTPIISRMTLFFKSLSIIVHRTTVSVQFPLSLEIPVVCIWITLTLKIGFTISFSVVTTRVIWKEKPTETQTIKTYPEFTIFEG